MPRSKSYSGKLLHDDETFDNVSVSVSDSSCRIAKTVGLLEIFVVSSQPLKALRNWIRAATCRPLRCFFSDIVVSECGTKISLHIGFPLSDPYILKFPTKPTELICRITEGQFGESKIICIKQRPRNGDFAKPSVPI